MENNNIEYFDDVDFDKYLAKKIQEDNFFEDEEFIRRTENADKKFIIENGEHYMDDFLFNGRNSPKKLQVYLKKEPLFYKFKHKNIIYIVSFEYINSNNPEIKYCFKLGILNEKNDTISYLPTNLFHQIQIFKYIGGIVEKFLKNNDIDILCYTASKKLTNICKYIYNKHFKDKFDYSDYENAEKLYECSLIRKR